MSHSQALSAMKVMMVVMAMALMTTTSHCTNINGSIVSNGYSSSSSSRCNGLTATACRIALFELDFDLEFMLDSEFNIRLLAGGGSNHVTFVSGKPGKAASCGRPGESPCHGGKNNKVRPPHCGPKSMNRECARY